MGVGVDKTVVSPTKIRRFLTILFGIPFVVCLPVFSIFYLALPLPEVSLSELAELLLPLFGFMFIFSIPAAIFDLASNKLFKAFEPSDAEREVMAVGGKRRYVFQTALWANVMILPVLFITFLATDKEASVEPDPLIGLALLTVISIVGSIAISSAVWNRFMSKK